MKNFFKWLEGDVSRGRRVVLLSTIVIYLVITIFLFVYGSIFTLNDFITNIYLVFTTTVIAVYGFFTGTSSDKSGELADKAVDMLMDRMDTYNKQGR